VAASNHTALVMINGGMLQANWADANVATILHSGYPGEYAGSALAAALWGDVSPAGRVSQTWYNDLAAEVPGIMNYSFVNRTYRFYEGAALYPFGHGLSYSSFTYSNLSIAAQPAAAPCASLAVSVYVTNTGSVASDEVVQVYLSQPNSSVPVPIRDLAAFGRIHLAPGQSTLVAFQLPPRVMAVLRDGDFLPVVEPGTRLLAVGGGQPGQAAAKQLPVLQGSITLAGPTAALDACPGGAGGGSGPSTPVGAARARGAATLPGASAYLDTIPAWLRS
jgi:beta-glucosidase